MTSENSDVVYLPSCYLPNISYFYKLFSHSKAFVCLNEQFEKQTYRNRFDIHNANGLQHLTIPVNKADGHLTMTKNIVVNYAEDWQKNHIRSIESAYRRTPYYEYYSEEIFSIISKNHLQLIDLNKELLLFLIDKIGLTVNLIFDLELELKNEDRKIALPKLKSDFKTQNYFQPFSDRYVFQNNLSIIDLLFMEGPNSISIIQESYFISI